MCRNIRTLHHFEPPASPVEIRASAEQFVRKLTGMPKPSKHNLQPFNRAIEKVVKATHELFDSLEARAAEVSRTRERDGQDSWRAAREGDARQGARRERPLGGRPPLGGELRLPLRVAR